MFAGAALLASAISAPGGIMYSLSGGYLGPWAQTAPALKLASRETKMRTNCFILILSPLSNCRLNCVLRFRSALSDTCALQNQLGKGSATMTDVAAGRTHGQRP